MVDMKTGHLRLDRLRLFESKPLGDLGVGFARDADRVGGEVVPSSTIGITSLSKTFQTSSQNIHTYELLSTLGIDLLRGSKNDLGDKTSIQSWHTIV